MVFGKHINKFYIKYGLFFIIGVIALIFVDYYQLEIPSICQQFLDGIIDGTLLNDNDAIVKLMLYLGVIAFIMFVGRFAWRYCFFGISEKIEADLRYDMFIHAEKLSNQYYKEHKTGGLMALFTNDLQAIKQSFGSGMIMFCDAIFLGGFALYRMIMSNWILTLISLIPMALIAVLAVFLGRIMRKKFELRQEAYENLSDFTQENYSGIAVIKAFVKEIFEVKAFIKINKDNYDKNIDFVRYSTILNVLLEMIISLIIAILVGGGSYFVLYGFGGISFTAGELWEFILYFDSVVWPFLAVSSLINLRSQAKASLKRVDEFLDEKIDIKDENVIDIEKINGKITFNHLTFYYPDDLKNKILDDISFTIEAGEMVGIVGKTGCGKTTIVDLLLRTYNLEDNKILIDDKDIMHLPIKKVRDAIGYVPQDNFLFSDTIKNNIAFALNETTNTDVEYVAKMADVDSNIVEFENGYNTILGERGVTLSGGQKQRVSIARALIKDPAILIFDDSVSAVDTKTEAKILSNLREIRQGKTTIMIAHRISTVEHLDKIILIDEGKVVGIGCHNELLKSSSLYQEMVHLQSLENDINGGDFDAK